MIKKKGKTLRRRLGKLFLEIRKVILRNKKAIKNKK
jgi:hypothetical protein